MFFFKTLYFSHYGLSKYLLSAPKKNYVYFFIIHLVAVFNNYKVHLTRITTLIYSVGTAQSTSQLKLWFLNSGYSGSSRQVSLHSLFGYKPLERPLSKDRTIPLFMFNHRLLWGILS